MGRNGQTCEFNNSIGLHFGCVDGKCQQSKLTTDIVPNVEVWNTEKPTTTSTKLPDRKVVAISTTEQTAGQNSHKDYDLNTALSNGSGPNKSAQEEASQTIQNNDNNNSLWITMSIINFIGLIGMIVGGIWMFSVYRATKTLRQENLALCDLN